MREKLAKTLREGEQERRAAAGAATDQAAVLEVTQLSSVLANELAEYEAQLAAVA